MVRLTDVEISGFGAAVETGSRGRISATRTNVHDDGRGLAGGALQPVDVVADHNLGGAALAASHGDIRGKNVAARDSYSGPFAPGRGVRIDGVTVTGSQVQGILAGRLVLKNGTVSGNGVAAPTPVDLLTARRPTLLGVTCDHSEVAGQPGTSWGVCAGD